jgi:MFS family permease
MSTATTLEKPSPFAVFKNRNFTYMWLGQLVSTIGSALTSLAASIYVYRVTGSALSVGLMLMATAAPSIFVGLIAGVFVDRYDRKRIMIAADILRAVMVLLIPFMIPWNIAWLYIFVMLTSAIGQFFNPAHESVLPEVASDEDLAAANSLIAISSFGSTAIGFAASGLIASRYPIEWAFYLNSLTFLLSGICIWFVRIKPLESDERTSVTMVVHNLKAGAKFLFDTKILRSLFIILVPIFLSFGLWNSLLLPFAERALHATEFEYGIQEAMTSIGFVLGSFLMVRLADRLREGQWLTISFVVMGVVGILYAFVVSIPFAILLVTLSGFFNAPSSIARRLVIQRNTPREFRGRVNSAFFVSRDVIFMVGMVAAGLADLMNIRYLVGFSAILLLGVGFLALFMPGLGQPAAEWKRLVSLLRAAPAAPALGAVRAATMDDFDKLVGHLPVLSGLDSKQQGAFISQAQISEAQPGTTIIQKGEISDEAYFILSGSAVAGIASEEGDYRSLERMTPGDFFGEIAALTSSPRTANVVAEEQTTLLEVPAETLKELMKEPAINKLLLLKMGERLQRTYITDMPRFAGLDQDSLLELRSPLPEA